MAITHVTIVSVPVDDPDRAKAFYVDVFGFDLLHDEPMGPTMRWIQLSPPGSQTTIALVTWFETMPAGSLRGLMLDTPDIDAEHARLTGLGVALSPIEQQPWGRFSMFADPDGNGLILRQPPVAN